MGGMYLSARWLRGHRGASMSEYEALAKNVIRRTLHIQPKENVIVETWNHGLPIATEVVYQVRAAGARPLLLFEDEDTYWKSVTTLPESKIGQVGSHEWRAMVLEASSVDGEQIVRIGRKVTRELAKKGRLEITHPNGTRFSCDLVGRPAGIEDGIVTKEDLDAGENMANIPAGEAFVVPDEKSGDGTIVFDRPIAWLGRWIRDLRVALDGGRMVKFSASENEDLIRSDWDEAKGPKDLLGYLDIGLNPRARSGFLQDAIVAGNVYVAVGANDEVPGGKNKTDFYLGASISGATVTIDGRPIIRKGALAA